ncbi:MAG: class I SAM-dependent RNA methyltransferase [Chloroflexi bacterium]|nr:class I SAM-dependent RNA methyltransferase [Chloroflexota bacterium]
MRVQFSAMAFGGEAIARHEGRAIFVPFAVPGDDAEIEIVEDRGRFARGRLVNLITPAPERIAPRCKYFGACGGCHYQHMPYAQQLETKTQIVRDQLARIGGIADAQVHATIGADDPWHYRNHIQFHVAPDGKLGFMAARTNEVVPVDECHILARPIETLWRELELELPDLDEVILRASAGTGERLAALCLASTEALEVEIDLPVNCVLLLEDGSDVVLSGDDYFREQLAGRAYRVSAESFFQVNTPQAERLVQMVVERALASGDPAQMTVLDAYCGVGVFALTLAGSVAHVTGIESAPSAVRDALVNTGDATNVQIVEGAVEDVLPELTERFDVIVLDPPREGCAPEVLDAIAAHDIRRIVYVSCDPSTLARDVKRLGGKGYQLTDVQPLDMFPQTFHIETIAVLERTV